MVETITSLPIPTDPNVCKSCGSVLSGKFCVQCGEKVIEPGERSIRHFLGDVLNQITFLDNKFLRTLRLMVTRPGALSYQYMNGRRVPFIKPMSMFFVANLIYFMFPLFNSLNSTLYVQMNMLPHSEIATRMVQNKVKEEKLDFNTFQIQYDQQSTNMAKMVLVLPVMYFSIPLALVNYDRKMYFVDHLLVSLELCSLIILFSLVGLQWLFNFLVFLLAKFGINITFIMNDSFITWFSFSIVFYLLFRIERQAYSQKVFMAITKSALLVFFFYIILQLYRASLFFITLWIV